MEDDELPAIELASSEVICDVCNYVYHRHQPACTNCKDAW